MTFFLYTRKVSWTHYRDKNYNPIEITHRCNQKFQPITNKKNPRIPWNANFLK